MDKTLFLCLEIRQINTRLLSWAKTIYPDILVPTDQCRWQIPLFDGVMDKKRWITGYYGKNIFWTNKNRREKLNLREMQQTVADFTHEFEGSFSISVSQLLNMGGSSNLKSTDCVIRCIKQCGRCCYLVDAWLARSRRKAESGGWIQCHCFVFAGLFYGKNIKSSAN